jgi:hypothetical protein
MAVVPFGPATGRGSEFRKKEEMASTAPAAYHPPPQEALPT